MFQIMAFVTAEDGPKYLHEGELTFEGVKVSIIEYSGSLLFRVSQSCNLVWEYLCLFFAGFCGKVFSKQVATILQVASDS